MHNKALLFFNDIGEIIYFYNDLSLCDYVFIDINFIAEKMAWILLNKSNIFSDGFSFLI